jgi:hypothetical protein
MASTSSSELPVGSAAGPSSTDAYSLDASSKEGSAMACTSPTGAGGSVCSEAPKSTDSWPSIPSAPAWNTMRKLPQ